MRIESLNLHTMAGLLCVAIAAIAAAVPATSVAANSSSATLNELRSQTVQAIHLHKTGNTKPALKLLQSVANQARMTFGDRDIRFAQSLSNLALIYDESGALDQAEKTYRQAIGIIRASASAQQNRVHQAALGQLQNNLAAVRLQQCQIADAHSLYKSALEVSETLHGAYHPDTAMVRANVTKLDRYLGSTNITAAQSTDITRLLQRCMS